MGYDPATDGPFKKNTSLDAVQIISIVTRTNDMVEGRGTHMFHKAFSIRQDAIDWVEDQPGPSGSKQDKGVKPSSDGSLSYNGYCIKPAPLLSLAMLRTIDSMKEEQLVVENQIRALQERAAVLRSIVGK